MSVLTPPRLYFKGTMGWNPNTANNNDQWPTYNFPDAELNWEFLATQEPPITPQNVRRTFVPWVGKLKCYPDDDDCKYRQPPAEWNYYGGNNCGFRNPGNGVATVVTGGQLDYGDDPAAPPVIHDDPVVGQMVSILGNPSPFAHSDRPSRARLVDVNPDSFWSSQIYLHSVQIGDKKPSSPFLRGLVPPGMRMHSRWLTFYRNLNLTGTIQIAGVGGCVFQISLPKEIDGLRTLEIQPGGSALLAALQESFADSSTLGVQLRFAVYTTQYFSSGSIRRAIPELAECDAITDPNAKLDCQYKKLVALWDRQLAQNEKPSWNPAISSIVGSFGVWEEGELSSMPSGRLLSPVRTVAPRGVDRQVVLSPAVAKLNRTKAGGGTRYYLSVDMGATVPEINPENVKADLGTLVLGVETGSGRCEEIGSLSPADYDRRHYDATAGIVDFPLPPHLEPAAVEDGTLVLRAGGRTVMREPAGKLTVQTDERGVYVEQGEIGSCTVQVRQNGAPPTAEVRVLLVEYVPEPPTPAANAGQWVRPARGAEVIELETDVLAVEPGSGGVATFRFKPRRPGLPMVVFFPYFPHQPPPSPPAAIPPALGSGKTEIPGPNALIPTAFFTCIRAMPFDDALPYRFLRLWQKTHDPELAWRFLYEKVLYVYDLLYPVMKYWADLDLGSREATEAAWRSGAIPALISEDAIDGTLYMPVTRELSAGKRKVFQLWGRLVVDGEPAP